MIERMKQVCIVSTESQKKAFLKQLKDMGILHIANRSSADSEINDKFAQLAKSASEIKEYSEKKLQMKPILSDEEFEKLNAEVNTAIQNKSDFFSRKTSALIEIDKISKWGDFDPAELISLKDYELYFRFFLIGKKEYEELCKNEEIKFIRLKSIDKMEAVAVMSKDAVDIMGTEFSIPNRSLSQLTQEIKTCEEGIEACNAKLKDAAQYLNSYNAQLVKLQNVIEDSSASRSSESGDGLVWITGYIPVSESENFTKLANENNWAWCMDDVIEDDGQVPSKVKYTKLTALMKPVFGILGTVPGYNEYDISFWFLCFFTLFFAMIIGDAAYGCIFLIAAIALNVKTKKMSDAILLLYVLSIATICWGSVTGTWFGLEGAMRIPLLKSLVIPGIANYPDYFGVSTTTAQNNVMKFCFSIGVVHLALACIMNIRTKMKAKNLSWVADLGWLSAICSLYFLVLYLVIGQTANLTIVAGFVVAGFLLVVFFGGMAPDKTFGQGLKSGLADAFTVFLNTISAFGNVMSYIRLFAVGMASLAIAQSFNDMAMGFSGPLLVAGAFIMVFGHVLNIVMGFLSVAVHGIRLNLLEFSGQLGMEWSGTEYDPFREMDKIRK